MVKSLAQENRAEPRHSGSKTYVPNHHATMPLKLLYQRPVLVWVSPTGTPRQGLSASGLHEKWPLGKHW